MASTLGAETRGDRAAVGGGGWRRIGGGAVVSPTHARSQGVALGLWIAYHVFWPVSVKNQGPASGLPT